MAFLTMSTMAAFAETATLDFVGWNFDGAEEWESGYSEHVVTFDVATVTFASANKQSTTLTDCPVTKGGDVTVALNDINSYNITGVAVTLKQWTTKAQTATLQYSVDGVLFTDTETSSDNFSLEDNALPTGTKALRIQFSSQSNQVGIAQIVLTYEASSGETVVPAPTFSIEGGVYYEAQTVALSAAEGAKIYYTVNGDEPTTSSTEYTAPIEVAETTTIKAIAELDGTVSAVAEATYTISNLFYGEDFEESNGGYTFQDVNLGELSYVWTWDEGYGQLKASAYVGGNKESESWAVSPEIDLTTAGKAELQVVEIVNFLNGNDIEDYCQIMISKNYIDNVTTADWTQLEATNRPVGNNWNEFTTDPVDLSDFVGNKVRLAFRYESTTTAAPTWEIAEITISGEVGGSVSVGNVAAEEGAKAIGGDGEIIIVGDANDVEVYNIAGALIEKGDLTNIACSTGIYVVKVDGKAQKVIVK